MADDNDLVVLEDKDTEEDSYTNLVSYVKARFERAKNGRYTDEERWIQAYRNYRGMYGPDVQFTETEKSRVFIKVTKTKVLAAYGQIIDVLFSQNRFPIGVEPTILPEGVYESVHIDPKEEEQEKAFEEFKSIYGFPGDGSDLEPGDTSEILTEKLGAMEEKLKDL